jgi:hypothetical protein
MFLLTDQTVRKLHHKRPRALFGNRIGLSRDTATLGASPVRSLSTGCPSGSVEMNPEARQVAYVGSNARNGLGPLATNEAMAPVISVKPTRTGLTSVSRSIWIGDRLGYLALIEPQAHRFRQCAHAFGPALDPFRQRNASAGSGSAARCGDCCNHSATLHGGGAASLLAANV